MRAECMNIISESTASKCATNKNVTEKSDYNFRKLDHYGILIFDFFLCILKRVNGITSITEKFTVFFSVPFSNLFLSQKM